MGSMGEWDSRTVKAFGVISSKGVGPLVQYQGTINAETYTKILQNNLLPAYKNIRGTKTRDSKLTYFHDRASAHTAGLTGDWFQDWRVNEVLLPTKSYDINIIENCWSLLKDELFKRNKNLHSKEDLWKTAQDIWYQKVDKLVPKLYDSIPQRLECIFDNDGKHSRS